MNAKPILCVLMCMAAVMAMPARLTRKYVTKGKLDEVTKACADARADSVQKNNPQVWFFSALVQERIYNGKNDDIYLLSKGKTDIKVDTAQFYSSLYDLFRFTLVCDSLERARNESKFRSKCAGMIKPLLTNLNSGGLWYLKKDDYKGAYPYFALLADAMTSPLLKYDKEGKTEPLLIRTAYSATLSAFFSQNYEGVVHYADLALQDSVHQRYTMVYKCLSLKKLGNTSEFLKALNTGMNTFPQDDFFYMELVNYYSNYPEKIDGFLPTALAQQKLHPDKAFYNYAPGLLYLKKEDYKEAAQWDEKAVARDSTNIVYLKDLGQCYFMMAQKYEDTATANIESPDFQKDRKRIIDTYRQALGVYERLRKLAPDDRSLWVSPLYTIYFKLNMGRHFQEIEKLMR